MTNLMMQHIPLVSAYLCQDCNSIGNNYRSCPACASKVLMSLRGVLDREAAAVEEGRVLTYNFSKANAGLTAMVA
jgi:DNA-directed RNA polymerase subunit RPC12/RpoP